MVCFRYIIVNTLCKVININNNNNNNNLKSPLFLVAQLRPFSFLISVYKFNVKMFIFS